MSHQAIDFLKTTFTSNTQPVFSDNASGIDIITVERKNFLNFIKAQEEMFLCHFIDRTSQRNGRKEKNSNYLSASTVTVQTREVNENGGRPSPLFTAVRLF
jgi:hypothetical protein